MNEIIVQAAKWVLIVALAGFIGYFGRYLAMEIIKSFRKEKKESMPKEYHKYKYKLEKKKLKLKEKRAKAKKK